MDKDVLLACNFHTHTQFCDGRDSMESIADAAVAAGITHLGFSPHSPIHIPSPCNMKEEDIPAYMSEIARLRLKYADTCRLYAGMEIDYLDREHGPSSARYSSYGLDFSIGSVHFIKCQSGEFVDIDGRFDSFRRKMHDHFHDDIRYVVETFYASSLEMLALGGFDILGHFDKIGLNASCYQPGIEQEGWYCDLLDDYVDNIIASGVAVEINTKAREEHGRFFPAERLWERLVKAGVPLVVNSDAHYASRVDAWRPYVADSLCHMGYGNDNLLDIKHLQH